MRRGIEAADNPRRPPTALIEEARERGGPSIHTQSTLPDWSRYLRQRAKTATWFHGAVLQIPTCLSLLTPEYQKRFVQQIAAYMNANTPISRQMSNVVRFSNAPDVFAKAERLYVEVSSKLAQLLPTADVFHVGSTAIQGSLTKGDLDVLVRVRGEDFPGAERALERVFARNTGSTRTEEFAAFLDDTTDPHLGVQLVVAGSDADTFLAWRDRLERDPELRQQYDELKRRFEGKSMDAYREAKSRFIGEHLG